MISRPNELLTLLKRQVCSLQFVISFHFSEQMSNKHRHTFGHRIMAGFWVEKQSYLVTHDLL